MAEVEPSTGKIEKVAKVDAPLTSLQERMMQLRQQQTLPANKEYFESLMRQEKSRVEQTTVKIDDVQARPSPMEEAAKANRIPSGEDLKALAAEKPESKLNSPMEEAALLRDGMKVDPFDKAPTTKLVAQTEEALEKIRALKQDLNRPDLRIKPSRSRLMTKKLQGVDENLAVISKKAGLEQAPTAEATEGVTNPVVRFLGMLTNSEGQLNRMSSYFEYLNKHPEQMTPATALTMQIKMHHVVTELEFFTSLLNKSLEGTKTIMQVQV
ncbi:MAG: hypothetical protein KDK78_05760 [Chlamydiia bacterium]|nr:hypothetical protein [Chlamydiia bacterium]